jgi:hypothetical protein
MKCQACDQPATCHVTEIVDGQPTAYHVCEAHAKDLDALKPALPGAGREPVGIFAFLQDPGLSQALQDPVARQRLAAHLLPALCLALLDANPAVRVAAIFRLMPLGRDAHSAVAALRDARHDAHAHVRRAAKIALEYIETEPEPSSPIF